MSLEKKKTTQEIPWLFANPFRLDFYSILYGEEKQFIICAQWPWTLKNEGLKVTRSGRK